MSFHGSTPPPLPLSSRQAGVTQPASALYLYRSVIEESAYDDQNNALPHGWIRRMETQTWTTFVNHQTGQQQSTSPNPHLPYPVNTVSRPTPPTTMTQTPDKMPSQAPVRRRRGRRSGRKSASRGGNADSHASNESQTSPALYEDDEFDRPSKAAKEQARNSQAFDSAPPPDPTLDAVEMSAAPTLNPPTSSAQTAIEWPPATTSDHPPARARITAQESKGPNKRPFEEQNEGAEAELLDQKISRKE